MELLPGFSFPVYSSQGLETHARLLAGRFEQAHHFLSTLLAPAPQVGLVVLSAEDWPAHANPALPLYGTTHYSKGNVVTGGPDTTFWQPFVETIAGAPALFEDLQRVYGLPDGEIDLTPPIEWWIVHDLGHGFHVQADYWFPRVWLMEFFADLCLYTYLAANEPAYLPLLETLPRLLSRLPAAQFTCHSLADFDTQYLKMDLVNYLWYHGHFFEAAKRAYTRDGSAVLQRMGQIFMAARVKEASEAQLVALLEQVQPELSQMMVAWPKPQNP